MKYTLVIAEKPSVARSIAAAIGADEYKNGYTEGNGYLVSWCFGHMADFVNADAYDERYRKWTREDLPIIPDMWKYHVSRDAYNQYEVLKGLLRRSDVDTVVNACDAGREGERIFRTVYNLTHCSKPMKRLWISSMEDDAIREGFRNLHPGSDYDALYAAAECRAKADWLVGINATRLLSTLYHRKLNVGRVMSPALAIIVKRQYDIDSFQPEPFYTVHLNCGDVSFTSEKLKERNDAEAMLIQAENSPLEIMSVVRKEKSEAAPALYDLTSLQRDANKYLNYTAQQTLDYLQSMYEKKLCTYPRTDSRYLTEDMVSVIPKLIANAAVACGVEGPTAILTKQVCDNAKVTDHHAIVLTASATEQKTADLLAGEKELLKLIARQMLCAVSGPCLYTETEITAFCGGAEYKTKGREITELGWRRYFPSEKKEHSIPAFAKGQILSHEKAELKEGRTEPPKQFTEGTLLASMEHAGEKETDAQAERKGLGTPATRAGIIEKLIATGFVARRKHNKHTILVPAGIGASLVQVLPEGLQSPLLTAEWENRLLRIEHGELDADTFLEDISQMVQKLTEEYRTAPDAEKLFPSGRKVIGICPRCGSPVTESQKGYFCEKNDCRFGLWRDNKFLTSKHIMLSTPMVQSLLTTGQVHDLEMYSERKDKDYTATLVMRDNGERTAYSLVFERK